MPEIKKTSRLKDLWSEEHAKKIASNPLALLRYRSNLLGADLRITNFGGGNTSSKIELPDPFSGKNVRVPASKEVAGTLAQSLRQALPCCTWIVWKNSGACTAANNTKTLKNHEA